MASKTNNYNAYESSTTGPLAIGAISVAVDSAAGLVAPLYMVIDPDNPAKREWIRVNTVNANSLENIVRNQEGSVGDVAHEAGAKVRSVPTKQIFDDIFTDISATELDLTQHETDGGDPHSQAGYLKLAETDSRYLRLTGGTLSGPLTLFADPSSALHAATKQYADAREVAAKAYSDSLDHDHTTPIAAHTALASAHHSKYTDADALATNPNRVLHVEAFTVTKVASGVTLTTFSLPSESGSCLIQCIGPVGFESVDRDAGFNISGSGVSNQIGQNVFTKAAEWGVAAESAQATLSGQLITIAASADGPAFYRGMVTVIKL